MVCSDYFHGFVCPEYVRHDLSLKLCELVGDDIEILKD